MTKRQTPKLQDKFPHLDAGWPENYAWAIDQMPCPAYCCSLEGAIVFCNASAIRLWGWRPRDDAKGMWDGFVSIHDDSGAPLEKSRWPAAALAAGATGEPREIVAESADGQRRWVVAHARLVQSAHGAPVGVLCCLTDVTEKRRMEQEARAAAEARGDFLTMLAHELRNPLAPIMSVAGLLRRVCADASVTQMADVVERQTKQLSRFITDLLDASRYDRMWRLRVEPRDCSLGEVLDRALDAIEPDLRARRQHLRVDVHDRAVRLRCDPERVAQALNNVLANASAFTPDGWEFMISARVAGETFRAEIVDLGVGIAAEDLPHIFAPFVRRAAPPGRAAAGAGLGLAIAKGICEAHGGSISAHSQGLGQGATFVLELPTAA